MTRQEREESWLVETVLMLIERARARPPAATMAALAELRSLADSEPDPNAAGAALRICNALEGVALEERPVRPPQPLGYY